jgi:hypothetical protein
MNRKAMRAAPLFAEDGGPQLLPAHVALARMYFRLGRKADDEKEKRAISELEEKQQQQELLSTASGSLERVTSGRGSA